jgi:hypothetical protein
VGIGISNSVVENQSMEQALQTANERRQEDYGLSMQERLEKRKDSKFVPREGILSLVLKKDNITIVCNSNANESIEFVSRTFPPEVKRILSSYPQELIRLVESDSTAKYGLDLSCPSPKGLLELIINQDTQAKECFGVVEANKEYILSFLHCLDTISFDSAIDVCGTIRDWGSQVFRTACISGLAQRAAKVHGDFNGSVIAVVIAPIVAIVMAYLYYKNEGLGFLFFSLLCVAASIGAIVTARKENAHFKRIKVWMSLIDPQK